MTVPALPDDNRGRTRPLPDYEPAEARTPRRPRTARRPRLALVPPSAPPSQPPAPPVVLTQVIRQVLEVLDRRRPAEQLRSVLPDEAVDGLVARLSSTRPGGRHGLRGIHTCFPTDTAVDVAVTIDYRPPAGRHRVFAVAARFEYDGERWVCVVLQLL